MAAVNRFIITLPETTAPTANSTASATLPALQVITDSRNQPWSAYATVVAFQGGKNFPLQCEPRGERLLCDAGAVTFDQQAEFEIFDADYTGGSVKGSALLTACGAQCADPLVWDMSPPQWVPDKDEWVFRLSLINISPGQVAYLGSAFQSNIGCRAAGQPCPVEFELPKRLFSAVTDTMRLQVRDAQGNVGGPSVIGNLRVAISPLLSYVNDEQSHFSGQNLVFTKLQVGTSPKLIDLTCVEAIDCSILGAGYGTRDEGYLYFVDGSTRVPLMLITDKGKQVVSPHKPKPATDRAAAASTMVTTPQTPTQQLQRNPATRLYSIKEQ